MFKMERVASFSQTCSLHPFCISLFGNTMRTARQPQFLCAYPIPCFPFPSHPGSHLDSVCKCSDLPPNLLSLPPPPSCWWFPIIIRVKSQLVTGHPGLSGTWPPVCHSQSVLTILPSPSLAIPRCAEMLAVSQRGCPGGSSPWLSPVCPSTLQLGGRPCLRVITAAFHGPLPVPCELPS